MDKDLIKITLKELVQANRVFSEEFKEDRETIAWPMYENTQRRLEPLIDKVFFYVDGKINERKPLILCFPNQGLGHEGSISDKYFVPSSRVWRMEIHDLDVSFNFPFANIGGFKFSNQNVGRLFTPSESGWENNQVIMVPHQYITQGIWDKKGKYLKTIIDYKLSIKKH